MARRVTQTGTEPASGDPPFPAMDGSGEPTAPAVDTPAPSPALAPPPGSPRFPLFDGLRGLAVLGILAFHVAEVTTRLGQGPLGRAAEVAGSQAVIVFFGISGFLLYRPFVAARALGKRQPDTGRYARRRALRILPGYWTILTLLAVFPGITGVFTGEWWRYYLYLQLYFRGNLGAGIPVAWTLCVEVTYYILLPVWASAVRRLPRTRVTGTWLGCELLPLAAVALLGLAVQFAAARQHIPYVLGVSLAGQITWIAIGMALAALSVAAREMGVPWRPLTALANLSEVCWVVGGLAFVGLCALVPRGGLFGLLAAVESPQPALTTVVRYVLEAVVSTMFVLPAIFGDRTRDLPRRLLGWRPVVWLGVISYSFYLWHLTVVEFISVRRLPGAFSAPGLGLTSNLHFAPTVVLYVVGLAATGVLASVTYQFIELPFLRRKEKPASYPRAR